MIARTVVHKYLLLALVVGVALAIATLAQETGDGIVIAGAWARPAPDAVDASTAYLRIHNTGQHDDALVSIQTADAALAELHTMNMYGDVAQMRHVNILDIPAGETVILEPGGLHIMLMGLKHPLAEGDTLTLTLHFRSGRSVVVSAIVSNQPIPHAIAPDALTESALAAIEAGLYVGQVVNPPIQTQDFAAPSNFDHITRFSDLDGKWRVIFFGYMHCPDFCPLTLVDYIGVKERLGPAANEVAFVFITVDAVRDTPQALRAYLDNFDPDFIGFSADDQTLQRIQPDYGFYYSRRMDADSQAVYTIDHSTRSYLVDRDGVLRASFAYDTSPQKLADAVLWYLEQEGE